MQRDKKQRVNIGQANKSTKNTTAYSCNDVAKTQDAKIFFPMMLIAWRRAFRHPLVISLVNVMLNTHTQKLTQINHFMQRCNVT